MKLIEAMKMALEDLVAVLCDPEGVCCFVGPPGDRALAQGALSTLRAAIEAAEKVEPELVGITESLQKPIDPDWFQPFGIMYAKPNAKNALPKIQSAQINTEGHCAEVENPVTKPLDSWTLGNRFKAKTIDEMEAFYWSRLPAIRDAARNMGYAIGVHGSARRDFDLMAMPWRDDASDKDELAHAIANAACGIDRDGSYQWEVKPQGRFAVSIPICWTDHNNPDFKGMLSVGHIDLSVISSPPSAEIEELRKDAERYRFMKQLDSGGIQVYDGPNDRSIFGSELDAAIDAAMEKDNG